MSVKENILLKAVTPFQMVFVQPKEMFCKDCFMKEIGEQELTAVIVANKLYERWIHYNVYCISVDGIVFRTLTFIKDFRQIGSQPKKGKK